LGVLTFFAFVFGILILLGMALVWEERQLDRTWKDRVRDLMIRLPKD
jgi:hypothetical protein